MESRPSASSVAKSPILFNASASASFHSHLSVSSSSSQRRLRALAKQASDELQIPDNERLKSPAILRSIPSTPHTSDLPLYNSQKSATQLRSSSIVQWLFVSYCLLSAVFFTVRLFGLPQSLYPQNVDQDVDFLSPINDMPVAYRLSRLLQNTPWPTSFTPFISKARPSHFTSAVTICTWIEAEDVRHLESWSSGWGGPLSVVVVTGSSAKQARKLVQEIENLPTVKNKAHFHMIQRLPNETRPVNAYLNLARLFAQTRYVVLFPAAPRSPIPKNLFRRLSMHSASFNQSSLASPLVLSPSKIRPNSPVPFPPLSPLLVEQSYPIWCSERFFSAPSRDDDWDECMWQFWLNSYGHLSTLPGSAWKIPSTKTKSDVGSSLAAEEIIYRRLSNRFRHESCVFAAKRLKDRSAIPGKVDPRKAQWLRKTCRQVMTSWGKDLL